ncbi:MAG: prepilin-type N-terminal cleavage/methylation domain-containing protein [Anaerovoracaceae bacterium]
MLQLRTILNTKMNKKGFTLAELLVVVAIIAILVAVSIPIFSGKLTEAKTNTDLANVRAAKAAAVVEYLSNEKTTDTYYNAENGTMVNTIDLAKKDSKGYNQTGTSGISKNAEGTAVVQITITPGIENTKPIVKATWVAK